MFGPYQPMSRKPSVMIIAYCILGFVQCPRPPSRVQNTDRELKCSIESLLMDRHSTFWFSSWANDCVSVCACVSSSSVPLMVHSEVVQRWTVKYSAIFSCSDSLRYPRTRKQQMNQGRIKKKKKMYAFDFFLQSHLNLFSFYLLCFVRQ